MSRKKKSTWETEQEYFPSTMRSLMKDKNITQKELADAIGMRPQTVSLYVTGQSAPDIHCLKKIAEFFDVSSDYLLGLAENPTNKPDVKVSCVTTGLSEAAILKLMEANRDLLKEVTSIPELSRLLETSEFWNLLDKLSLFRHECRVVKYRPAAYTDAKERGDADAMERHKKDWSFAKRDRVILAYEAETSLRRLIDMIEQEVENNGKHHKDD